MDKRQYSRFENLSDEELAVKARNDKEAAFELFSRCICIIKALAGKISQDNADDLIQEGFIGLMNAVKTYDSQKNSKFSTYAYVCIRNKMISANHKLKHIGGEISQVPDDLMSDFSEIPDDIVLEKVKLNEIYDKIISALSEQEWRVFQLYLTDLPYNQIADKLNCSVKTVDNAMQRVRNKLKSVLRSCLE
ncbi:MAG: sigma-70 family RNA polymerase sigma factor [Oscillospiraceae bacterium]